MKSVILFTATFCLVLSACTKDHTLLTPAPEPFVCDSTVGYLNHTKAIFDAHCAIGGCHIAPYPAGGVYLSDYNNTKIQVLGDDLMCSIHQEVTCTPMPYPLGSPPLSDSLIAIIECWRDHGCPQ